MRKNKQKEPVAAKPPAGDNTQVKIDIDEASREMESLLVVDDDPPPEPIDTTESDAYIL